MKSLQNNLFLISICTVFIGLSIIITVFTSVQFNSSKIFDLPFTTNTFNNIQNVSIDITSAYPIKMTQSSNDNLYISYPAVQNISIQKGDNFSIKSSLLRKWYYFIQLIFLSPKEITLSIPTYTPVLADLQSPEVTVENLSNTTDLNLKLGGFIVSVSNVFTPLLTLESASGYFQGNNIEATMNLRVFSSFTTIDTLIGKNISLYASSGSIKFNYLDAQNINLELFGGSVEGGIVGKEEDFDDINQTIKTNVIAGFSKIHFLDNIK